MSVPQLLLETLEDLGDDDFEKFKWYLSMDILEGCKPIPKSRLGKAPRTDTVSRMTESYSEESAVKVTVEILLLCSRSSRGISCSSGSASCCSCGTSCSSRHHVSSAWKCDNCSDSLR